MAIWTILLAAGSGTRLQAATAGACKQFLMLEGRPMYWRSAMTLARVPAMSGIIFVTPEYDLDRLREEIESFWVQDALNLPWRITAGGARRQDSVRQGLAALPEDCQHVLVHDAARPFASATLITRVITSLQAGEKAVIPAIPVKDTIKACHCEGSTELVRETLDRQCLRAVQTPQAFATPLLRQAHAAALEHGWGATDDASLIEILGQPVVIVAGEEANVKITTPKDLELLTTNATPTIPLAGWGYDVHKYAPIDAAHDVPKARPMKLGGVPIPKSPRVIAHSDGDVLLHALTDALASLIGAGDIGTRFPDSNPDYEGMNSAIFLHEILQDVWSSGLVITHVDLTIIAQTPKVGPYREAIQKNVSLLLKCEKSQVNVKATTEEGLGFTGEKKGIKAVALVSAIKPLHPQAESRP